MQKSELKVLIIDDDKNLGKALSELVDRTGYKAIHVTKPDEALSLLKIQPVHFVLIDCMLPKMNGRELAVAIRKEVGNDIPIVMMSGIYKDKVFVKETLQTTGAIAFLAKPFDLDALAKLLNDKLKVNLASEESVAPLPALMRKNEITQKERVSAVNDSDVIHGFDLPWVYSLLMHPSVSGHLNIINADGEVAGVGFAQGQIVQVNLADSESFFGSLLIENGFIDSQDLNDVLTRNGGKTKRIGEKLVEANVLSPHAIESIVAEQLVIRLSKTISNTSLKINFVRSSDLRIEAALTRTEFARLVDDWVMSKITMDWLKASFVPWMNCTMAKGPEYSPTHRCLTLPILSKMPKLLDELLSGKPFEEILAAHEGQEDWIYRAVQVLILARVVIFDRSVKSSNYEPQRLRLTRLNTELAKQNHFERLGVSNKAKEAEIKRNYLELAKVLHPDKLAPEVPADIRELTRQAFEKINQAHQVLINEKDRSMYVRELEHGSAELILQAEAMIDQGKQYLTKGDVRKANDILSQAANLAPPSTELRLLLLWAKLKSPETEKSIDAINKIKDLMAGIPPEERHSSMFYFIRGLMYRVQGDYTNAVKSVQHAVSIDSDFIEARRELNVIKLQAKESSGSTDIMKADLKDVVGMLFKKKK